MLWETALQALNITAELVMMRCMSICCIEIMLTLGQALDRSYGETTLHRGKSQEQGKLILSLVASALDITVNESTPWLKGLFL